MLLTYWLSRLQFSKSRHFTPMRLFFQNCCLMCNFFFSSFHFDIHFLIIIRTGHIHCFPALLLLLLPIRYNTLWKPLTIDTLLEYTRFIAELKY